ncbi:MAG: UDP-3-O-[3-hydroxymyristoyl] N-acetylglucosamine deacetylase [Deltaproteobacteria bacterium]|nr:UDP-3-O-[3-hydroxymyristoyl] N-acetylglucosamine deacetylase [Deltaproteobacteria bacterium]
MKQTTLRKSVCCSGIGLHSGQKIELTLRPADSDTGILFVQVDGPERQHLSLGPERVVSTGLATSIGNGNAKISTVEHLLGAVQGMGIDNLVVEVCGPEIPILDGSAAPFVFLFHQAGLRTQNVGKKVFALKKTIRYEQGGKWIKGRPYDGLKVRYTIDFGHPRVGRQVKTLVLDPDVFVQEISRARTFGFLRDVEALQRSGLARGGSLENALVLDEYDVVNPEGMRFDDEPVRHKILDFLGDMFMLGRPIRGDFLIHCSGHALNNDFCRFLFQNRDDYLSLIDLGTSSGQWSEVTAPHPGTEPAWV